MNGGTRRPNVMTAASPGWRPRIGLAIASDTIRAVEMRGGTIRWTLECPIALDAGPLDRQVAALLGRAPRSKLAWPRATVVAAIGPTRAQVKRVTGLPPVRDARLISGLLRESASRFFLASDGGVVTGNADVLPSGDVWGAAFDRRVVDAVVAGCATAKLPLLAIVPAVVALPLVADDDEITWTDGDASVAIRSEGHRLAGLRRQVPAPPIGGADEKDVGTVERMQCKALSPLGEGCERFAVAVGAALVPTRRLQLAIDVRPGAGWRGPVSRSRAMAATVACAVALVWAVAAPGVSATRAATAAERELATMAAKRAEAAKAAANLEQVTSALRQVASATIGRGEPLALLAGLTEKLPDGAALVTMRFDSIGGSLVVLAPNATSILARLDSIALVTGLEIVGPVTRETVGGRDVERLTIRFRFPATRHGAGRVNGRIPTSAPVRVSVRGRG